jgi:hypothetical protein
MQTEVFKEPFLDILRRGIWCQLFSIRLLSKHRAIWPAWDNQLSAKAASASLPKIIHIVPEEGLGYEGSIFRNCIFLNELVREVELLEVTYFSSTG